MKNTDFSARNVRHIHTAPSAAPFASAVHDDRSEPAGPTDSTEAPVEHGDAAEQLTLLTVESDTRALRLPTTAHRPREVHARFRLSKQTREIGLRHVNEIKRQLEEAKAAREDTEHPRLPRRRPAA